MQNDVKIKTYANIGGTMDAPQIIVYNGDQVIHIPLCRKKALELIEELAKVARTAPERIEDVHTDTTRSV